MTISFRGISSGLEVNKIIEELMQIERQPIRRSEARISLAEQRIQHWRELNLRLDALQRSLQPLLLPSTYSSMLARSADSAVTGAAVTGLASEGSYRLNVEQIATRHSVAANPGEGAQISDAAASLGLSGTFYLGTGEEAVLSPDQDPGRWITVEEGDSLNQIAQRINTLEGSTGVKALVIKAAEGDYRLLLQSRVEGEQGRIHIEHFQPQTPEEEALFGSDPVMRALYLVDLEGGFIQELQEAKEARLRLNGLAIQRSSNTVDDLISGVTLTLKGAGETTVDVAPDQDKALKAVQGFIEAYNRANALLRSLQDRENGPLRGDPVLMRAERQLRQIVSGMLPDPAGQTPLTYRGLADIGIKTADRQGYLELDETVLRSALREDALGVYQLLGGQIPAGQGSEPDGPGGLARQLRDHAGLMVGSQGVISGRQSYLQQQIRDLQKGIERWAYRLEMREKNLVRQFAMMEQYISVMQGQSGLINNFSTLMRNSQEQ